MQVIDRGRQRPHPAGQLGNQVLLVATLVCLEHHVLRVDELFDRVRNLLSQVMLNRNNQLILYRKHNALKHRDPWNLAHN